jgi:hypothetical protein
LGSGKKGFEGRTTRRGEDNRRSDATHKLKRRSLNPLQHQHPPQHPILPPVHPRLSYSPPPPLQVRIDGIEKQAKQQVANLKEQSAFFIHERTTQLRDMAAAHAEYKQQQEAEKQQLLREGNYVADYVESLTLIIERLEVRLAETSG